MPSYIKSCESWGAGERGYCLACTEFIFIFILWHISYLSLLQEGTTPGAMAIITLVLYDCMIIINKIFGKALVIIGLEIGGRINLTVLPLVPY